MFFWFNTVLLILMAICIIINENSGAHWVILPLFWAFERAIHGVTLHIWWAIRHKEYSPGLLSSILFWMLLYFISKYGYAAGLISDFDF